jgi:hypothetical protein
MRKTTLVAACAAAFFAAATAVLAQIAPGDTGAGIRRGLEDIGFTGQAGTVTIFHASAGSGSLVVINTQGQPSGKMQSASIQRGKSCNPSDIDPHPTWMLNDVHNGKSATVVNADESRLLSGNYVVIVHAGQIPMGGNMSMHGNMNSMHGNMNGMTMMNSPAWKPALCGQLYAGT